MAVDGCKVHILDRGKSANIVTNVEFQANQRNTFVLLYLDWSDILVWHLCNKFYLMSMRLDNDRQICRFVTY